MSSEIFQKRVSQALEGLEGILNITHDILVYGVGDNEKEARVDHDRKLKALLNRCRERGMALNKNKLKLRISKVSFMGHIFSKEGIKIDPDKVKAVLEIPSPEDVEGVQRLNGFVNYLAKFYATRSPNGAHTPFYKSIHRVQMGRRTRESTTRCQTLTDYYPSATMTRRRS